MTLAEQVQAKLIELSLLKDGWDSYGGDKPTFAALLKADRVILSMLEMGLTRLPQITPTPKGGVYLLWILPTSMEVEIQVLADASLRLAYDAPFNPKHLTTLCEWMKE